MKIAILGSGGREHAIAIKICKSKKLEKLYCIPGNAGTNSIAQNVDIKLNDFSKIYNFLKQKKIDLVIVGPEKPLVDGIVDYLEKKNIKVFGPNQKVSQLEGSKIFTKKSIRIVQLYLMISVAPEVFDLVNLVLHFFVHGE